MADNNTPLDVQTAIDIISRESGFGRRRQAYTNLLYGINHRGIRPSVPHNTDNQGITFFTRPRLNMTYDNLIADRTMTTLLAEGSEESLQRYVRVLLDPILGGKDETGSGKLAPNLPSDIVTSHMVNSKSPFMAILSNLLSGLTGWQDPTLETFTSHEGINKEAWSMGDGQVRIMTTFELTATFRNVAGDPISFLFNTWIKYISNVYTGKMLPYPDMIVQNEIDYMTRIYRFTLDPSRQYITKCAAVGAAFPYGVSLAGAFNFSHDQPFSQDNAQEISVPFRCIGCDYMDPITMHEFNLIVQEFNPNMANPEAHGMKKLSPADGVYGNGYGYPRINERTFELQWWVDDDEYVAVDSSTLGVALGAGQPRTKGGASPTLVVSSAGDGVQLPQPGQSSTLGRDGQPLGTGSATGFQTSTGTYNPKQFSPASLVPSNTGTTSPDGNTSTRGGYVSPSQSLAGDQNPNGGGYGGNNSSGGGT